MLALRQILVRHAIGYITMTCLIVTFTGCKRYTVEAPPEPTDESSSPTTGTRMEFTLDSIFLYAKQTYLWYDALPAYDQFAPRHNYSSIRPELTAYQTELFDITQFGTNTGTGLPYEHPIHRGIPRYSYLEEGSSDGMHALAAVSTANPVVHHTVIQQGGKQVAYLVLGGFPRLADHQAELDDAFDAFAAAETTELVIDLRNNNGGYVETAAYIANLIVHTAQNGNVMFTQEYNPLMQNGRATILEHQLYLNAEGKPVPYRGRQATLADIDYSITGNTYRFDKKGTFQTAQNLYFIVSRNTASAAELLISCLKPYFDVLLVGEKTYGKPVGFFPIHIDKYAVYLSSFIIKNATGWHDYFDGIPPNVAVGLSANPTWGDRSEPGLKTVLSLISGDAQAATDSSLSTLLGKQLATEPFMRQHTMEPIPMMPMELKLQHP